MISFCLSSRAAEDTQRVEIVLLQPQHLNKLINIFKDAKALDFPSVMESLSKICAISKNVAQVLARRSDFVRHLLRNLENSQLAAKPRRDLLSL